ncbi:MAG: SdpI family protein [Tepidisphaeraceae bacterium]
MMPLFLAMFLAVGGLCICMSIPLIQRKVPPNRLYGFRVRRTLEDPNVWYPANAYAAWRMLWAAIAAMIVAVGAYLIPGVELAVYASIVGAAWLIGLAIGLVQSFIYLRKLTDG